MAVVSKLIDAPLVQWNQDTLPWIFFLIKISSFGIKMKVAKGSIQNSPLITMNIAYHVIPCAFSIHIKPHFLAFSMDSMPLQA